MAFAGTMTKLTLALTKTATVRSYPTRNRKSNRHTHLYLQFGTKLQPKNLRGLFDESNLSPHRNYNSNCNRNRKTNRQADLYVRLVFGMRPQTQLIC